MGFHVLKRSPEGRLPVVDLDYDQWRAMKGYAEADQGISLWQERLLWNSGAQLIVEKTSQSGSNTLPYHHWHHSLGRLPDVNALSCSWSACQSCRGCRRFLYRNSLGLGF